ncbi:unnamed protein product [Rhizoctonia solani]|uniref:Protein kinase domain-containing protein n=1 Tax=Rhizoctonia solani TaxID=456999 RepID=A0A8H3HAN7_9AGAM|nr:unnamed protein product [Rhizoctonia solani]
MPYSRKNLVLSKLKKIAENTIEPSPSYDSISGPQETLEGTSDSASDISLGPFSGDHKHSTSLTMTGGGDPADPSSIARKKKRGRPLGSKHRPGAATAGAGTSAAADATPPVKKKRGRPPKVRTPEELAAIEEKKNRPKGKRGRPPKKLKAEQAAAASDAKEPEATTPTSAGASTSAPLAAASAATSDHATVGDPIASSFLREGSAADLWLYQVRKTSMLLANVDPEDLPDVVTVVKKVMRVECNYFQNFGNYRGEDLLNDLRKDFHERFQLWRSLSHPNLATLYLTASKELTLFQEYCKDGDLREYIKKDLSETDYIHIITDVLGGIDYLHSRNPPIAHGCINPGKIYMKGKMAKLGEFGLSQLVAEFPHLVPSISVTGMARWMSPEYFNGSQPGEFTAQGDMWSFGSTLFECEYDTQVLKKIMGNALPGKPESVFHKRGEFSHAFAQLMQRFIAECWSPAEKRPSSLDILAQAAIWSLSDLLGSPRYYMLINGYPTHKEHQDEDIRSMFIKPESIRSDLKGMDHWVRQIRPNPNIRWYWDEGGRKADSVAVRKVLSRGSRAQPTLIYLAGHTEKINNQLAYAPADYINTDTSGKYQLIPYEVMPRWLLNDQHSASLVVSFCENFLQLPYVLEYEGKEARWVPTGYPEVPTGKSSEIVHFAATSPDELSIEFNSGAVFTKAFYDIRPSETWSLKDIAKKLQENVDTILSSDSVVRCQHPKVYCSRVMDEPHFFAALGFYSGDSRDIDSDSG